MEGFAPLQMPDPARHNDGLSAAPRSTYSCRCSCHEWTISRSTRSDMNLCCCSHWRRKTLLVSHYGICDQSRIIRRSRGDLLNRTTHQFVSKAASPSLQRRESGSEVVYHPLGDLDPTNHRAQYVRCDQGCDHWTNDHNADLPPTSLTTETPLLISLFF